VRGEGVENRCRAAVGSALRADRDCSQQQGAGVKWQKVKLGALYEVHNGLSKPRDSFGSGFPFLSYSTVFNNFFLPDQLDSLVMTDEKEQSSYSIKEGDVFITRTSETSDELGMSCVALKDYPHATYNGFCKRLRPITKEVFPRYIGYYLRAPEFRSRFDGLGAAMITRASLKNEDLLAMTVALPPLPVQRKIAEILGAYDDLIENNRRRIALLEKMARELYRERFVRRAGAAHAMRTLEDIGIRLESGSRPKGGIKEIAEGIPSVGAENVIGLGQYNYCSEKLISREFFAKMKRGVIRDRDILLYKDGAYIGRVSLFQDGFPHKEAAINEHVFLIHTNDEALQYYIFFTLAQERYFKIIQGLNENAAQPGLNQGSVLGLKIEWPEEEDIKAFDRLVAPFVSEIFSLALQNRNLARQRDRLLPRLLSGRLEVRG